MDDLKDRMERLASRVDTAAAPDLEQVRQRHTRRRRTSGLTVGVALAAIVALLAIQIVRTDRPTPAPPAGDPTTDILTVWPSADVGPEEWRSSPEAVITRFAQVVLGWSSPDVQHFSGVDGKFDAYWLRPEPCPPTARCVEPLGVSAAEVASGVFSIRSVSHPQLKLDTGVTDSDGALSGGSRVRFDLELGDDRAAHIGMVASNGCREATAFEVGLDAGTHQLQLPEATPDDPECDDLGTGYVFAYTTDDTTVPVGDPLREAAAIEFPWLTIIPIHLQMEEQIPPGPTAGSRVETLTVRCGLDPHVFRSGSSVVARPDGVHLELVNAGTEDVLLHLGDASFEVGPGSQTAIAAVAPGSVKVGCTKGAMVLGIGTVEIADPAANWVDPESLCTIGAIADFEVVRVPEDDLFDAASRLVGLDVDRETIGFEFGGYMRSPTERIFVVSEEDGNVVGMVTFRSGPGGLWTSTDLAFCE